MSIVKLLYMERFTFGPVSRDGEEVMSEAFGRYLLTVSAYI